jgi:SAM-dependent methyltransferase
VTFSARLADQLAHPRGLPGRLLGKAMDRANERPVRLAVEALDPTAGERILDAGCGTGAALAAVRTRAECRLYGIDQSEAMIAAARNRLGPSSALAIGRIETLPEAWPQFDAVLALNVLYFAGADGAMVASLRGALRPSGRLIAYVTHRENMARWRFARVGRHRLYDARELEALLMEGGFAKASIWIKDHAVAPGIRGLVARAER